MPTRKRTSRDAGSSRRIRRAQNLATSAQLRGGVLDEVAGDEEAGDDEEDIDPDEPADEVVGPQVVEQNDSHSQCSKPLNVGAKSGGSEVRSSSRVSFQQQWLIDCIKWLHSVSQSVRTYPTAVPVMFKV